MTKDEQFHNDLVTAYQECSEEDMLLAEQLASVSYEEDKLELCFYSCTCSSCFKKDSCRIENHP